MIKQDKILTIQISTLSILRWANIQYDPESRVSVLFYQNLILYLKNIVIFLCISEHKKP